MPFLLTGNNLNALNQVSIERDWYDDVATGKARLACIDNITGRWEDLETGRLLAMAEIGSLRHYQMKITYDDRVRTQDTQPPGLPRGKGTIFGGLKYWEELPSN